MVQSIGHHKIQDLSEQKNVDLIFVPMVQLPMAGIGKTVFAICLKKKNHFLKLDFYYFFSKISAVSESVG